MILLHGTCLLCTSDLEGHGANICNARVQSLSVLVTVGHREGEDGGFKGFGFIARSQCLLFFVLL